MHVHSVSTKRAGVLAKLYVYFNFVNNNGEINISNKAKLEFQTN